MTRGIHQPPLILPYNVRVEDLDATTRFLKSRPTGATEAEIARSLPNKITDERKVALYELSGFVQIDGGRWRLTSKGSDYVHGDAAKRRATLQDVLRRYGPFHESLSWAHHNNKLVVTANELRHKWVTDFAGMVSTENKYRINGAPLTFFSLCDHAGLGKYIVGRRGAASRFEFNRDELRAYVEGGAIQTEPVSFKTDHIIGDETARLREPSFVQAPEAAGQEFAFPLANHHVISVTLPDEIPEQDVEDLKSWFQLMLRRRTKPGVKD